MLTQAEAKARVEIGAAALDKVRPGWYRDINPLTLRMNDSCLCIMGQLTDGRWQDLGEVVAHLPNPGYFTSGGFYTPDARDYPVLAEAWLDLIAARLRDEQDAPVQTWTMRERTGELVR
jgi:hypothetical protein